jgi:hypothetical protein
METGSCYIEMWHKATIPEYKAGIQEIQMTFLFSKVYYMTTYTHKDFKLMFGKYVRGLRLAT